MQYQLRCIYFSFEIIATCALWYISTYSSLFHMRLNPFMPNSPLISIGPIRFRFKGCWMEFYIFIKILIDNSVSKQWRS